MRVILQVNNIHLVDTLHIMMGGLSYNEELYLAQVASIDGIVNLS